MAVSKIGSEYSGSTWLKPFNADEEKRIMPHILGLDPGEKEFRKACDRFYQDTRIDIPLTGLTLETGLSNDGETPLNAMDYYKYRFAKKHSECAANELQSRTSTRYRWFIEDHAEVREAKKERGKIIRKAMQAYLKVSTDALKTEMILELMEPKFSLLHKDEYEGALQKLANDQPEKFLEYASDKKLEIRGIIKRMLTNGVLRQVGNSYFDERDEKLGDNLEDTITWFGDAANAGARSRLEARLKEFTR